MMAPSSAMQRYSRRPTPSAARAAHRLLAPPTGREGGCYYGLGAKARTDGEHSAPRDYKNDYVPEEGLTAAGRALVPVEHP